MARIGGQVEELVRRAEDDLGLLYRRAVAFEPVVDPASNDPAAELRESPTKRGPSSDHGRTVLERHLAKRKILQAGEREVRTSAQADFGGSGEEALPKGLLGAGSRRDLLLEDRDLSVFADGDHGPRQQRRAGRAYRP